MSTHTLTPVSPATAGSHATHEVFNQAPPFEDVNLFTSDAALREALAREGGGWAEERVRAFGEVVGRRETISWGFLANDHSPVLRTHDRTGRRIDEVEFHPAYHSLLGLGVEHGLHSLAWREPRAGANAARAAMFMLLAEVEAGVGCPLSMTHSVVPALRHQPELAAEWEPRFTSTAYDPRLVPAGEKGGALCGMAMTEKQGGSDVRANTTQARPLDAAGEYELTGHKWFCSAPMCDAFLVLAQAPGGLSCFLVPRFTPDGERNPFHIQRLKEKLGNRSNASSEVEFRGTWARRAGEEGRGVQTILEMVNHTRLDCVIGSAAGMRWGTARAIHHARHRRAFGKLLIDQPLMRNVLADLAIESEAATVAMMRLARSYDPDGEGGDESFRRLATAVLKYQVCKRAPVHAAEALECLGGNGYVEEWGLARLYREAPLNGIWEGSGNVQCLDVLRALQKSPESLAAFFTEIAEARGADARLDAFLRDLQSDLGRTADLEPRARHLVERLALALQASLLLRHAPAAIAEAFCANRLGGEGGRAFGTLPSGVDFGEVLERAG